MLSKGSFAQLIVNEISQGNAASGEYIELMVKGARTCLDSAADIRKWIVDDNNGWLGSGSGQGIATGCLRFADNSNWANVPFGSIILLYDDANKNTSITLPDDPTDANNDLVYVVPVSSILIESNTITPSAPSSSNFIYPTTGFTPGGNWSLIGLANGGDGVIIVAPSNLSSAYFSFGYGTINDSSNATVYNSASGSGIVFYLSNEQYNASAAWSAGSVPANETPGAINSPANAQWLNGMRQTSAPQTLSSTVFGCGSAVFNGVTYTSSTTITDTIKSLSGCDSIYRTTGIVIKNLIPAYQTASFSVCRSVMYNGVTYTVSTDVLDTLKSIYGCDSVYRLTHINIQNITPVIETIFLADCNSVTYNNTTFTSSITIRDSLTSTVGCDSVFRIVMIRISAPPTTLSADITGCGSVVYNNVTYTDSVILRDTLRNIENCDSIYKITNINVKKVVPENNADTLHGCNTLSFNGVTYDSNAVVLDTLRTAEGCDSIYRTTNILIQKIIPVNESDTLSGCSSVAYHGTTYTTSTVIDTTITTTLNCDSVYKHTHIIIKSITPVIHSNTLTDCNRVNYQDSIYSLPTIIRDTVRTAENCDSIYNVTNIVIRVVTTTLTTNFISCSNVFIDGTNYTNSTIIRDTVKTASGCDSIYKITNIDIQNHPVTQSTVVAGCGSVLFNGVTYTASATIKDTLRSIQYCDSVYRITNITVKNIIPVNGSSYVTGCNSVVFNGITYTSSAIIKDTLHTPEGCDSVYRNNTINVVIVTPATQTTSLTGCGIYVFHGITYTSSAAVTDTLKSVGGCDSIYTIININIPVPANQSATVYGCSQAVFNGITYTTSTIVNDTLKSAAGCDSVFRTTNIMVQNVTPVTQSITLSGCSSVYYNGVTYASSTDVTDTIKTSVGCDSLYLTVHVVIEVIPVSQTIILNGCGSVVYNGITYTSQASFLDTLHSTHGCDSVYQTTNINIQNLTPVAVTQTLFGCNSLSFNGGTYNDSAVVRDTLKSLFGCDSIYRTTAINIQHITPVSLTTTLTACNSLLFHGILYTTSATLADTIKTSQGCDSVYNITYINIIHLNAVTQSSSVNACNSYVWNGMTYTSSVVLTDTLRSTGGCDSVYKVVNIHIQNIAPTTINSTVKGCNSVVFNGITYTASATLRDTIRTTFGCDSLYKITNIIVQHLTPVADTATLKGCGSIVFHGVTYTSSTVVTDTLRSIAGCDSLYHQTRLDILKAISDTTILKGCNSLVFNGNAYTASVVLRDTLRSTGGCDSVYKVVNINIQNIASTTISSTVKGCNSVVFNGITYTASATLRDTIRTTFGCDSFYKITNIIVQHVTPVADTATLKGCGSIVFHGVTYTSSTVVTDTVRSIAGCDSLYHQTRLDILKAIADTTILKGCNSLVFDGITYTASVVLKDTLQSTGGCDSVYKIVNLNIQNIAPTAVSNTAKGCNSVVFNGITYTASATLRDTIRTTFGCDSVYKITNIIVQHITSVTDTATLKGCGSIVFHGVTYNSSTVVTDTVRSIAGCDSLYHQTRLDILKAITDTTILKGCNSLVFHGITYTASTAVRDTVKSTGGCDSIYHITILNIQNIIPLRKSNSLFGCNSLVFNGVNYTASVTVLDTLRSTMGCDSVYRTNNLTLQKIVPVSSNASLTGCRMVLFNGVAYTSSIVVKDTMRTTMGCDSVYNFTTITVNNFKLTAKSNPTPVFKGSQLIISTSSTQAYNVIAWMPQAMFSAQTAKTQTLIANNSETITVVGESQQGCRDTTYVMIDVKLHDNFFVPNTFTPNGDGMNDVFKAYGNNVTGFEMRLFNQWGEMIFESNDFSRGWDGITKGKPQPTGVYVYVVKAMLSSGEIINRKGSINLVR